MGAGERDVGGRSEAEATTEQEGGGEHVNC